jgi:hypothetical protein
MVSGLESCALQRLTFADALSRNFQDLTPSFDALSRKLSRPDTHLSTHSRATFKT